MSSGFTLTSLLLGFLGEPLRHLDPIPLQPGQGLCHFWSLLTLPFTNPFPQALHSTIPPPLSGKKTLMKESEMNYAPLLQVAPVHNLCANCPNIKISLGSSGVVALHKVEMELQLTRANEGALCQARFAGDVSFLPSQRLENGLNRKIERK